MILGFQAVGLVKGLNKATRREEAEIISARKLAKVEALKCSSEGTAPLYGQLEARVMELRKEWLDAVSSWETLRAESKLMQRANSTYQELRKEFV